MNEWMNEWTINQLMNRCIDVNINMHYVLPFLPCILTLLLPCFPSFLPSFLSFFLPFSFLPSFFLLYPVSTEGTYESIRCDIVKVYNKVTKAATTTTNTPLHSTFPHVSCFKQQAIVNNECQGFPPNGWMDGPIAWCGSSHGLLVTIRWSDLMGWE